MWVGRNVPRLAAAPMTVYAGNETAVRRPMPRAMAETSMPFRWPQLPPIASIATNNPAYKEVNSVRVLELDLQADMLLYPQIDRKPAALVFKLLP